MKALDKIGIVFAGIFFVAAFSAMADELDVEGSKDHPLFSRMPNYYISYYEEHDFDAYAFVNSKDEEVKVEGHRYYFEYNLKEGAKYASQLQIIRNYTNAIKKIGGTVEKEYLDEAEGYAYMRLQKGDAEIWAHLQTAVNSPYWLNIVQKGEMVQEVVSDPEVAKTFAKEIGEKGKVAIYGIHFDTNKAEVKPESEPVLKEVAILLSENPGIKLYVVGHTDSVGEIEYNMKLSQARAEAVVKELITKHGVSEIRVKAYGVGPLAPVTSNKTEEGRAKNRRVELIEQ